MQFSDSGSSYDEERTIATAGRASEQPNDETSTRARAAFIDQLCSKGTSFQLHPQQRLPTSFGMKVILLRRGMLAVDAKPAKERLQVLDFLVPGDVVAGFSVVLQCAMSMRAITTSSIVLLDPPSENREIPIDVYCDFLWAASASRLLRANIHQLMIGRLETEQRVASFLYGLALRRASTGRAIVDLPMSRTDIANYLVINMDTLSRTMMRFCYSGLIKRENRHAIRIIDREGLAARSPLSQLLRTHMTEIIDRQAIARPPASEDVVSSPIGRTLRLAATARDYVPTLSRRTTCAE